MNRRRCAIRVLIIGLNYTPERTGIAPYTAAMAQRLAARGDEVRVLTTFPHYPEWHFTDGSTERTKRTDEGGVKVMRIRHKLPKQGSSISRFRSELSFGFRALFARWNNPDVVVLVSPAMFASALLALRVRLRPKRRMVVWVQDLYGPGVRETGAGDRFGMAERVVEALERNLLKNANGVAVIHDRIVDDLADLGIDKNKIEVVRNWSHVDTTSHTGRAQTRRRLGWRDEETIVLHTGNMGVKQDLGNVIEAARIADADDLPMRFVLVGDGNCPAALVRTAEGVGHLSVLDPQPMSRYMDTLRAADVLLVNEHPSLRSTALPSKLTSYFASGRPVLAATNEYSLTALELERAQTGERVDAGDPNGLVTAVHALAAEPLRMRRLADHARRFREAHLTEDVAAGAFAALLDRVAGTVEPAPASPPPGRGKAVRSARVFDLQKPQSKAG